MAFCPECGKAATTEATRCIHCGHELPVVEKKAAGGRFKGTMIMAQPVAPQPTAPANGNSAAFARDVTPLAPAPELKPAVATAATAATKSNVKATMIGQGIGPLIAQQTAAAASSPRASASVAESAQQVGYAKTQALIGAPPPSAAAAILQQVSAPDPDAFETPEAGRYLPGDPMAPHAIASAQQPAAPRAPRLTREDDDPDPRATLPGLKDRKLIFLAVGGVVLLSVLLLAFGLMH